MFHRFLVFQFEVFCLFNPFFDMEGLEAVLNIDVDELLRNQPALLPLSPTTSPKSILRRQL